MQKKFAYENPAVFEVSEPKKEKISAEEMRLETLKEMKQEKPFIQRHFFVVLAAIIALIFLIMVLVFLALNAFD